MIELRLFLDIELDKIIARHLYNIELSKTISFTEEKDGYSFIFNENTLYMTEEYIKFNDQFIDRIENIKLEEKKGLLKNSYKFQDIEIEKLIYILIIEWKERKEYFFSFSKEHYHNELTLKNKLIYLDILYNLLKESSEYITRIQKYILIIGIGLGIERRKIYGNILKKEARINNNILEYIEKDRYILWDYLGYFKLYELELPQIKILNYPFSKDTINFYEKLKKLFIKDKKRDKYLEKKILSKDSNRFKILEYDRFINSNKNLTRERGRVMSHFKLHFSRGINDIYSFEYHGKDENKFEYLKGLETEEGISIEDGNNDVIDFNEFIQSKTDKVIFNELEKKHLNFKKTFSNVVLKENEKLEFPKVNYRDITEYELLGYLEIGKDYIQNNGIWGNHGVRKFELVFVDFLTNLKKIDNIEIDYKLNVYKNGNETINEELDISSNVESNFEDREPDSNNLIVKLPVDTDILMKYIENGEQNTNLCLMFNIIITINDTDEKFVLGIPLPIKLLDPSHKDFLRNKKAAIDFGTSSTCIAISRGGKKELLLLEKCDEYEDKAYENPTNLLFKNWEELYEEWKDRDTKIPNIVRIRDNKGSFDQGHRLKEYIQSATKADLNAYLDQLKLIPYKKIILDQKIKINPSVVKVNGIREIELTIPRDEEKGWTFDAVEFYGYLLGRVAMAPLLGNVITKYYVTVPVKFDKQVKESILKSLKKGIKIATPLNIREKVEVIEGDEEPVAFMGAMYANPKVREKGWKPGSKFAVFDFGGGTLDFSFGIFEKDPEDDEERVLKILNTDGEEKGGAEYLIHKLSYIIYKDNKNDMKEKRIPFIIPIEENLIDSFPPELQIDKTPTKSSIVNLKKINERVSRILFENGEIHESEVTIELENLDEETLKVELGINVDKLKDELRKIFKNYVKIFKNLLIKHFGENYYERLHIFKAGNGSRSILLDIVLNEEFEKEIGDQKIKIHFIDEDGAHSIKPKTAVALGQLELKEVPEIKVEYLNKKQEGSLVFEFSVGKKNIDNAEEFIEVIGKGETDRNWRKYVKVNREEKEWTIFYTASVGLTKMKNLAMKTQPVPVSDEELENGYQVWIRPDEGNKLEYVISKEKPNDNIEGKIIEIRRG